MIIPDKLAMEIGILPSSERMPKVMAVLVAAIANNTINLNEIRQLESKLASQGSISSGSITENLQAIAAVIPESDPDLPDNWKDMLNGRS